MDSHATAERFVYSSIAFLATVVVCSMWMPTGMVCGQLYIVSFDSLHGWLACCCGLLRLMQLCLDPAIARIACTAIPYILCYRFTRVNSHWSGLCYGYRKETTNCMYAHAFDTNSRRFLHTSVKQHRKMPPCKLPHPLPYSAVCHAPALSCLPCRSFLEPASSIIGPSFRIEKH